MKYFPRLPQLFRLAHARWLVPGVLAVSACTWLLVGLHGAQAGPGGDAGAPAAATPAAPAVRVTRPQRRTIVRTVGQPSFVESYERTSIYPKVTGYIENWDVDIGDRVKKGQALATLYVPELREDWQTKKETVRLDQEQV